MAMFDPSARKPGRERLITVRIERGEDTKQARSRALAQASAGMTVTISTVVNETNEDGKRTGAKIYTYRQVPRD